MQLIILGMHRSGTSVLARLLNMMGAYFGPEGISTGANKENPKGFWERRDVRQLNDYVLHSVNCDWDKISDFDIAAVSDEVVNEFKIRGAEILLEMDAHRPWLLKEPRLCLLLDLWKQILEVPIGIHIHRNPVEVANSLYTRNGIPVHAGIALWEKYNRLALSSSHDMARFSVSHHRLMTDPVSEVKNIYKQLQLFNVEKIHLPSDREIVSFIKTDLYRERVNKEELLQFVNKEQASLYEIFENDQVFKNNDLSHMSESGCLVLKQYEKNAIAANEFKNQKTEREEHLKKLYLNKEKDIILKLNEKEKELNEIRRISKDAESELAAAIKNQKKEFNLKLKEKDKAVAEAKEKILQDVAERIEKELVYKLDMQEKYFNEKVLEREERIESLQKTIEKIELSYKRQIEKIQVDYIQQLDKKENDLKVFQEVFNKLEIEQQAIIKKQEKYISTQLAQKDREIKSLQTYAEKLEINLKGQLEDQRATYSKQIERQVIEIEDIKLSANKKETELIRQIEVQENDFERQMDKKQREIANFQEIANKMEAALEKQLKLQEDAFTQKIIQKDQEIKSLSNAASKIEFELRRNIELQAEVFSQQSDIKDNKIMVLQEAAHRTEKYLRKQAEDNDEKLTHEIKLKSDEAEVLQEIINKINEDLINQKNKSEVALNKGLFERDKIIDQLLDGIDVILNSRIWKVGEFLFVLRRKLLFKDSSETATRYLEKVRDRYYGLRDAKKIHMHENEIASNNYDESYAVKNNVIHAGGGSVSKSIDIVVCVHNALEDVRKCLDSIVQNTFNDFKLLIVDDGSDEDTKSFLLEFNSKQSNAVLFRNDEALGYTKSANIGLKASSADYVILLNSDTIVTPKWDKNIVSCGESDSKIGIIGPLSNAASWQSVPERYGDDGDWMVNEVPEGMNIDDYGRLVNRISKKEYPIVPLVNGFCFAIKRDVIEKVGYLDEVSFPRGYGEENDYCLRAARKGFLLAISDDTYVFHAKSKSFTHEGRKKLAKQGSEKLKGIYGKQVINNAVSVLRESTPLENMRKALSFSLSFNEKISPMSFIDSKLKVIFLLPVSGGGGGVHSIVQETLGMQALGVYARVAVPDKHKSKYQAAYPTHWEQVFFFFKDKDDVISYAGKFDIAVATIFTSVKLLQRITVSCPNIKAAYYIQDYEPWFCEDGTDMCKEALDSYTLIPGIKCFAKTNWICETVKEKHGVEVAKVMPSIDRDVYYPPSLSSPCNENKKRTLCAMIRPKTPRRSPELTMQVLKKLMEAYSDSINIVIFGCEDQDPFFTENNWGFNYSNYGHITREEVSDILRESDVFLDLSEYQAFGRTGLEAMACACVPVLPSIGGVYEYAVSGKNSLVVNTAPEDMVDIVDSISSLISNPVLLAAMTKEAVLTSKEYSLTKAAQSEIDLFLSFVNDVN